MRTAAGHAAHVLERTGLALAGAAGGLFVATHVGTTFLSLLSQGFLVIMMIAGAAGFYFGVDIPPHRFQGVSTKIADGWSAGKIDLAELLTAVGTFLAALCAAVSIAFIVFFRVPLFALTYALMAAWVAGTAMQIVAGAIARSRAW